MVIKSTVSTTRDFSWAIWYIRGGSGKSKIAMKDGGVTSTEKSLLNRAEHGGSHSVASTKGKKSDI